ncbi:MAG: ribosomal protein [Labilithrix sp.]|nr:ribosomal protein [Labilithrix sp.]
MALKTFRPITPVSRYKQTPSFDEITKSKPEKSLLQVRKRSGGRNNQGIITRRHIGGGHKKKYRIIDFKRCKQDCTASVVGIEYDPNRTARIALLKYTDGTLAYILAPNGLQVGATLSAGPKAAPDVGNALPLRNIPLGTSIHNVELVIGRGGRVARSAGQSVTLNNREVDYALV